MTFQETINHAKELLRNSMDNSLKFIVPHVNPDSAAFDELIQIEGRLNHIEKEFNKGIIDSQDKDLRLNQIRNSLLQAINEIVESDIKAESLAGPGVTNGNNETLLVKLRESIAEIEKLKSENELLKSQDKKHKLKIIIQCEPEIGDRPNRYTCQCVILNDETGESTEKEIPLRKEPGGIVVTIHDINPSDYVQIRIKDNDKEWESDYFSPQFLTQVLRLV